jgi:FkbM family methyltransferase
MNQTFPHTLKDRACFEAASRGAARAIYVGNNTSLCWVADRFKMYVPSDDISLAPHLMLEGYWESWISVCFARVLSYSRPKSVVNVGANVGYYALMASALDPHVQVDAYEPQPKLARLIQRSAIVNGFSGITVHEAAVGDSAGTARLQMIGDYYGSACIVDSNTCGPKIVEVPLVALDKAGSSPIEALFIDAEGYEYEVMRGASHRIDAAKNCVVFLEFSASRYSRKTEFVNFINERGFSVFQVTHQGSLKPLAISDLEQAESVLDLVLAKGLPDTASQKTIF